MEFNVTIDLVKPEEYPQVTELWEASVRATHDFLTEEDIQFFKPLVLNEFLPSVNLSCIRTFDGNIVGFMGVAEGKLEALFIHPDFRGKGIGRILAKHAIENQGVMKVDVNEQNKQAVDFYLHVGFKIIGRSETDAMGKPFPLLFMEY